MQTTRRDFVAGLAAAAVVPAEVGVPQAFTVSERCQLREALYDIYAAYGFPVELYREWPYDRSGGLREQLDELIELTTMKVGDIPDRWDWVLKSDRYDGISIDDLRTVYFVLGYEYERVHGLPQDGIKLVGRKGWYFEHRKTGERVLVTEDWMTGFYNKYYKENASEGNTTDIG